MSYEDPQHWGDVDSGGNALDWTTRKNKLWYPGHEMLRKALVERFEVVPDLYAGHDLPAVLLEPRELNKIYVQVADVYWGATRFFDSFQMVISDLIPEFVNYVNSDGNWDGASSAAFAPEWTEESILKAIGDWRTGSGTMATFTDFKDITVTLDEGHTFDIPVMVDVSWLEAGVPKSRSDVLFDLIGSVATLTEGSGNPFPNDIGLAMTIEGGRILPGYGGVWHFFPAAWTLQQYKILNALRWIKIVVLNDRTWYFDSQRKSGLADWDKPWADVVLDYVAAPWVNVHEDNFVSNVASSTKNNTGGGNASMFRSRAKVKLPGFTYLMKTNVDWYGFINDESPPTVVNDEGMGFSEATYWLFEADTPYIASDDLVSGYPTDREDPYVEPADPPFGQTRSVKWVISKGPAGAPAPSGYRAIVKFDVIDGFQFLDK